MSESEKKQVNNGSGNRKSTKNFLAVLFVALGLAVILLLIAVVFPNQDKTRRRLEEERAAREQELLELELEQQSLQELAALIGNRNYLIRYLREHQGYMYEGDIRVDVADPAAVIPTPDYPYSPTSDPSPSETPDPELSPSPTGEPAETPSD